MDPSYQEFCLKACLPRNCFPIIDFDTFAPSVMATPWVKDSFRAYAYKRMAS